MQVDPIKPTWKPTGTKRLKLQYDELLSNFAFKFNLRRYTAAAAADMTAAVAAKHALNVRDIARALAVVGRCRLTLSNPHGKRLDLSA